MNGKQHLAQLYAQKGEIITDLEVLQAQLRGVNEKIINIKNKEAKQKDKGEELSP